MASYELNGSNISVTIEDAMQLSVNVGESAALEVGQAINYIQSGRAELQPLVIAAAQSANNAETSAQNASDSATAALGYAERAETAAETAENMADKDLSNLSETGEAKFDAKQDVIRDLSEIRQGAALGATAVQPSELESYATTDYVDDGLSEKQDTLTAGANIQIVGNTISATDTTYTAGTGISIVGNVISNTQTSAIWGNITGTLSAQTDLQNALNLKANTADIPTATSDLTNDSGFITSAALTPYATQNYVNTALINKQDTLTQTQLDAVNSGANSTNIGQIATNTSDIADINALIPNQASSSNQLADKDFVNSSIATNTATFRGTFNSVAELEAYSGEKDNNDYAFVTGEDSLGNTYYDNYVYNGTAWAYRYRLNNSSFTAAQWSAINSGATSTNIGQITINANNIADLQTNKQDVISDLTTIRSNALAGKNASDTIATYGNIVTHNVSEFATSSQGALADTSLQPNDNISELTNDAGYITSASLPTVNNGTLDIQVNGTSVGTFTANQVGNTTANIVVPDSATWGNITGTLSNQTDLQSALDGKADDSNVVHKTGSETITGFKTFTNKVKITSSTAGAILELESGASNTNFLLKRTSGATCVLESGDNIGLFGTQSAHSLQIRTNYENRMTFDTSGNVTLTKAPSSTSNSNQVATTAWTISKIPTDNNQLTNGAGYITGITSSDVTTALGYTPYNSSNPNGYITSSALTPYVLSTDLSTVATSGSYNDLSNKPDLTGYQTTANLVTSVSSSSTDTQYPSAKLFYDTVGDIESAINTIRGV